MNDNVRRVNIRDCSIGGPELMVMAGPCSIESREQIFEAAETVAANGARFLRGGAFKVRTSPTAFQGLGWEGEEFSDQELGALRQWAMSKTLTIAGGTSEIQLNIIAKRALGLPQ